MLSFMFAMIRCLREDDYQLKDSIQSGEGDLQVAAKFSSTRNALHACSRFFSSNHSHIHIHSSLSSGFNI